MSKTLASYAAHPDKSRGRLYYDAMSYYHNQFQKDVSRVIESTSFRRLKHKTQVFISNKDDHCRTRLTHSLEVAQIGRTVSRYLSLSSDLTEVLCLAHDLGHPPFGHKGEEVLNKILKPYGGFNHNVYTLKLVTELEEKYVDFNGLNLAWETLEGLVKHNGPLLGESSKNTSYPLDYILKYNEVHDLDLHKFPSLEAQVASIADDIAYNCHDIEDALKARIFTIEDLEKSGVCCNVICSVLDKKYKNCNDRSVYEIVRSIRDFLISDLINNSKQRIKESKVIDLNDVGDYHENIIGFSKEGKEFLNKIVQFLFKYLYKADYVMNIAKISERIITDLYKHYTENFDKLPSHWKNKLIKCDDKASIVIADYIAGMTDVFAYKNHSILFPGSDLAIS